MNKKLLIIAACSFFIGSAAIYTMDNNQELVSEIKAELQETPQGQKELTQFNRMKKSLNPNFESVRGALKKMKADMNAAQQMTQEDIARLALELAEVKKALEQAQNKAKNKKSKVADELWAQFNDIVDRLTFLQQKSMGMIKQLVATPRAQKIKRIAYRVGDQAKQAAIDTGDALKDMYNDYQVQERIENAYNSVADAAAQGYDDMKNYVQDARLAVGQAIIGDSDAMPDENDVAVQGWY